MEWTRRNVAITILAVLLGAALLGAAGAAAYFEIGYGPDEAAVSAVETDDSVTVERFDGGTVVRSGPVTPATTGLVYYPGARVNHESYVPTAAGIVEGRDAVVVVVDAPLNLAILSPGSADAAVEAAPAVESWYVGGHSLGGATACRYAAGNAAALEGLVLHAAYCDRDLSGTDLRVLSVLGAEDAVIDAETERQRRDLLPDDATVVELSGVTHSGFGAYGTQRGEGPPPRSPAAMRADVARTTGTWLVGGNVTEPAVGRAAGPGAALQVGADGLGDGVEAVPLQQLE
ncbi:alpha/beta hydrolase [Natronomonas marina]|uniref:alpha/beta hydrolase n=1 Tax=Natronomonas marina TaxID=2961939 RepID=UPI0020C93C57|nr:alpha/beta hydrolase [Natronomonas marina]